MINIIKQKITFDESLKQRLEFICEFSYTIPTSINGFIHKVDKTNLSGTTSKGNNAIQNASGLTKVDNHNCRKYDDKEKDIEFIRSINSVVNDVKKLYKDG